ncbi:MAG: tetratricopeptide repeat protein [Myxococcota bacterium]
MSPTHATASTPGAMSAAVPPGATASEASGGSEATGGDFVLAVTLPELDDESDALARQTGHCDLPGVVAAQGSWELAERACERDLQVERDLADGLLLSSAARVHLEARRRHMAGHEDQAREDYGEALRRDAQGRRRTAVTPLAKVNLGLLHYEQGDPAGAILHLRWVLEHATEDSVRGAAYHNLSLALLAQGEADAAYDAAVSGHRVMSEVLGPSHGSVGASLNALGVIEAEREHFEEAIDYLERAVDVRTAALGPEHPATAASLTNLGVALGRMGRWEESLDAHRQALAIDIVVLGPEHATTAADHGHVGAALVELGEFAAARESFDEALAILEPVRPEQDPELTRLRGWLARCDVTPAAH